MAAAAKVLDDDDVDGNDDKGTPPFCRVLHCIDPQFGQVGPFFPGVRAELLMRPVSQLEIRQKGSEGWKLANHKSLLVF